MNSPVPALGAVLLGLWVSCASVPAPASVPTPVAASADALPSPDPVSAAPADPAWKIPDGFRIVGYFPGWSGDPVEIRFEALTHVNYAFVLVDATGAFLPADSPEKLDALVARAHAAGTRVLATLGGWNGGSTKAFDKVASDPERIRRFVEGTLAFVEAYRLDGVDLDWEYPKAATAAGYAAVVRALAEALRPRGLDLSLAVSANDLNGRYVLDEAWKAADWVNVMAYDDGWAGPPGTHHSSYAFARAALDYWIGARGLPAAKVVLGVPFYGRNLVTWQARSVHKLVSEFPGAVASDVAGGFAFNGVDTLRAKVVNQARVRAGGVMVWQLNQDAVGPDSLLGLIYDTVKEPIE